MPETTDELSVRSDERLYVYARIIVTALLLTLLFLEPPPAAERLPGFAFTLIVCLGTLYAFVESLRDRVPRAMRVLIYPDLLALGALSYVFDQYVGPFYPVAVILVVAYALQFPQTEARVVAVATAATYALGRQAALHFTGGDLAILIFKVCSIGVAGWMVSAAAERQNARERSYKAAVEERERINRQLQRHISDLQGVAEITEIVHSSLDLEEVGPRVLDILADTILVGPACLFVVDKTNSQTLFSVSRGVDKRIGPEPGSVELQGNEHFCCTPILDLAEKVVMFCAMDDEIERLTDEDRLVLSAVSSELVVAVENSRLYKLTKTLAVTDELTGLYNYRHLQHKLDEEIERARRYGKRLSLVMVDLDDFKRYNDVHGHLAGDKALAEFGRVLASVVREVDVVARYGGEEFSIVLPETDATGAFIVAEKAREAIAEHEFPGGNLTVSVGLATFPTHAWDRDSLLREADGALYNAKTSGKNRVRAPHAPSEDERTGA